jgi:Zn-dependent protease with chaperone function
MATMSSANTRKSALNTRLERRFPDRPLAYPTVISWLLAGGARDWRSLWVGYLLGWGLLPLTLIGAVFGSILGAVSGFQGSVELVGSAGDAPLIGPFITWAWSALGGGLGAIVGFVLGGVLGGLSGFLVLPGFVISAALAAGGILQLLIVGSLCLLFTVLISITYTVWMILSEGPRTGVSGYRRMSRREAEQLVPLVHNCARLLGFSNAPRILIDDAEQAQAYALTRHIVITRGLLNVTESNQEALAGVICHELMHWRNADAVSSLMSKGLALPMYLLYNLGSRGGRAVLNLTMLPLTLCLRYAYVPIRARESRAAEFRADLAAAQADLADGLMAALEGFRELESGRSGWDEAICATHPPIELRLERLEPYVTVRELQLIEHQAHQAREDAQ